MGERLILRAFVVWLVLIGVEIAHGVARALWLVPIAGDFRARQIGVLTGSILNFAVAALFIGWIRPGSARAAWQVGIAWLALTVAFEVLFGRLVARASWSRIGSDYDLLHGGLLPFGLLLLTLAPLLTAKWRHVL